MLETITQVDYDRLWSEQLDGFDHGAAAADYWDRRSKATHCDCWDSNYAAELMGLMDLRPEYSVLDVGCGCGAMAIPLARRVARVTALDISSIRLEKLSRKAAASGLTNIDVVNLDWNRVTIGEEVGRHDIVMLSRCVPTRLSETLRKIDLAARSSCYITWRADRADALEIELAGAIGKSYRLFPDHSIIFRMLRQMGVPARTRTFETFSQEKYPDLREAALSLARGAELDDRQFARVVAIAGGHLTRTGDGYASTRKTKWVLTSWEKTPVD